VALDLQELGAKLRRYREQLQLSTAEVGATTGIGDDRLRDFEAGANSPTGDEILILADFYKCDYRFFVSNERRAAFEQTENLYRRFGSEFSKSDRWGVQEFLFLCECEEFLTRELHRSRSPFHFQPSGTYFKAHGERAAAELRRHLGHSPTAIPLDVYADLRKIGIHVFRRRLENSNISGLTVRHPYAGPCVLVNYSEDIYRQRFTAAHECAHAILDKNADVVVSFTQWDAKQLIEVRANTFASAYLLPPSVISKLPVSNWNHVEVVRWANKLKVNTTALAIALKENRLVNEADFNQLKQVSISATIKADPELDGLTHASEERKRRLLQRGLSSFYVALCFDAVTEGIVTNSRAAEMLLVSETELTEIATMFGVKLLVHD
jgi:Zn-dependent peptidase ImmA (M78 family)/transcriptional regulator with XRE-family HTH domain